MKSIIRVNGFFGKELREIVRQPGLVVALILGPFLILLMFGLGHSATQPPLATILVVPRDLELPVPPDEYQQLLGPTMRLVATTDDQDAAMEQLRQRQVDLVVVAPADPYQRLASAEQATLSIVFNEIDPVNRCSC